jgi:hypothetical protein
LRRSSIRRFSPGGDTPPASSEKPARTAPPRPIGICPIGRPITTRPKTLDWPSTDSIGVPDSRRKPPSDNGA